MLSMLSGKLPMARAMIVKSKRKDERKRRSRGMWRVANAEEADEWMMNRSRRERRQTHLQTIMGEFSIRLSVRCLKVPRLVDQERKRIRVLKYFSQKAVARDALLKL